MKQKLIYLVGLGVMLSQCTKQTDTQQLSPAGEAKMVQNQSSFETDRYLIKFKDQIALNEALNNLDISSKKERILNNINPFLADVGLETKNIIHTYSSVYPGIAVSLTDDQLQQVLAHPLVDLVSKDQVVTLDYIEEKEPRVQEKSQSTPWGVQRTGRADGSGKTAWVLDTGVDLDHPDLNVDALRSQSFATGDGTLLSNGGDDNHGHGTHVAGTIAAIDNNIGVVGVAPNASVVAVKVLGGNGSGLLTDVIAGVDYVAALSLPGDVANMSLSSGANPLMDLAVQSASLAGTWYVMAAGNDRRDANLNSPARANGSFLVTVSAFRNGDSWAYFSNYGNPPVDYAGPGLGIKSTYRNGGYRTLSGTSMAAPHLAGLYLLHNGAPNTDGVVSGDPDGNPDPIAIL